VRELQSRNKQIFLDLKVFDIGETVKRTVKVVVDAGVSFLTIHGNTEIIMAAAEARGSSSLKLLSVTVLTSLDVKDIRDLGYECSLQELVLHRAVKALEAGCDGVISSPREAKLIKEATHGDLLVVTPGIRPLGAQFQDQKRVGPAIRNREWGGLPGCRPSDYGCAGSCRGSRRDYCRDATRF
jgi:orotidine-5'-phosphate decarboxylase